MNNKNYNIERFIKAQDKIYETVVEELKRGFKESHWMWFIFPQLEALGYSSTAKFYGISGLAEAKAYVENETLINRYIECCKILLGLENDDIHNILGSPDDMKLKSSLTLFIEADGNNRDLYIKLLDKYYDGKRCKLTITLLNG